MRSPPEPVRRTLAAAWVLLNCDRFEGRSEIRFDETRDWYRCQRMIAGGGFIARVLEFSPERLDRVPHVTTYLLTHFFGHLDEFTQSVLSASTSVAADAAPSFSVALPRTFATEAQRPLLNVESVSRASLPCGALYNWMAAVIRGRQLRPGLLEDIAAAVQKIQGAETRLQSTAQRLNAVIAERDAEAAK